MSTYIKLFIKNLSVLCLGLIALPAMAQTYYDGPTGQKRELSDVLARVQSGQIIIISEQHGLKEHHQNQRDLLVQFSPAKYPLSVGMEFFSYPEQEYVDQYTSGKLAEDEFLKLVKWGKNSFDDYRFQVKLPFYRSGQTLALNAPRTLSGKIAKEGMDSLTEDERKLLPPQFTIGAQTYFERFQETMKNHATPKQIQNYFAAQSLWDETMAWRAAEYMSAHPNALLVIIVGDFHVAYQDGLVARLHARGMQNVVSISQVDSREYSDEERAALINPDPQYGSRADFIFDVR